MHISIFVYGTWGDIRPHVVLGQALQKLGHEVQVIASPTYEAWVRARGLSFYRMSADVNTFSKENASIMDQNIVQQLKMLREKVTPIFVQMGMETLEATRNSDVLMTVEFGIPLLFDVLRLNNLKMISLNPAPLNPSSEISFLGMPTLPSWMPFQSGYSRFTYGMLQRLQWSAMGSARNQIAKKLNLPKSNLKDYQAMLAKTPALTTVSKHIAQRPSDWSEHWQITGYLFDDDPEWKPPQALTDFLASGEPPVYIGFGSMVDSKPQATTQLIIDAVKKSGKRAVILTGWAGFGANDVPENIHILKYAPHSWLFPKMSAVVHHGGAGTTASAFRAGVPMTIVPHAGDQSYWGRVSQQLGVGSAPIPKKKLQVDNLAEAIGTITSTASMREKARVLSQKIEAEDGLATAVQWITRYLS